MQPAIGLMVRRAAPQAARASGAGGLLEVKLEAKGGRESRGTPALVLIVALIACSGEAPPVAVDDSDPAVAVAGAESIRASELDAPLRLQLYDLEAAAFELRRQRLQVMVESRWGLSAEAKASAAGELTLAQGAAPVQILLSPPPRPRLAIDVGGAPMRGDAGAPVVLAVFCDYASTHCRHLQPVLASLLHRYPGLLQLRHLDAPRSFHPGAERAAAAARCALQQGRFWSYHDALYVDPAGIGGRRLQGLARLLGLDGPVFEQCLAGGAGLRTVQADMALAGAIGVRSVPVAFVNGLYVKGAAPESTYEQLIGGELARLGLAAPPQKAASGATAWEWLGLRLVATKGPYGLGLRAV